jgi:hypothetical protein
MWRLEEEPWRARGRDEEEAGGGTSVACGLSGASELGEAREKWGKEKTCGKDGAVAPWV